MRGIFRFALVSLLSLYFCAFAFADAMLYRGQQSVSSVPSVEKDSVLCVPVEDVGRIFGFSSNRNDDELTLSRGNAQIRISLGATAGWYGYSIIPLHSAPFVNDGKFWIDTKSAAALFQRFSGRGAESRLRFAKVAGKPANDFGDFGDSDSDSKQTAGKSQPFPSGRGLPPKTDLNEVINRTVTTNPYSQQTARLPQNQTQSQNQQAQRQTQTQETLRASRTQSQQTSQASQSQNQKISRTKQTRSQRASRLSRTQRQETSQPSQSQQQEITASAQESEPVITASAKKSSGKKQPRMETFSPDDSKTDKAENYSGTIQGIRWTAQEGTHKKIRAVVMADEDSDPQVYMDKGKLHALFASSLENTKSIASPFAENITAEIKTSINGAELIFTPEGIIKAEKLVLNNPRRIVFDFFYPEDENIAETQPQIADVNIQLPGQVTETQTAKTPAQSPAQTQTETQTQSEPDRIIITGNQPETAKTPATMTPPSSITIPTSPKAAERLRAEKLKKTIVIDPGHGGKDPGAMDNGVREKDINLAVGLELHKVLTERGYNAIMTRATDVYLKLQERTDIANNVEADLFVSVHVNALPRRKSMSGFEIYIMALPTDKDAMELAKAENREYVEGKGMDSENVDRRTQMLLKILGDMQQNNKISESTDFAAMLYNAGVRNGLPMRRVAQAPFFVLRGAGMPAVLLEIGFVTNANESQLLTTQAYQQRIANAMAEGIINYIR